MTTTVGLGSRASIARLTENSERMLTPEKREKLLLENLSEVRRIARRIHSRLPRCVSYDDLVHDGVVGLIDAVEKYDPAKNVRLQSYARFRIRGAILDSLREMDWGPRYLRRQARSIEQASGKLAFKLGRFPSEPEVATELGVSLQRFQQVLQELNRLKVEASHLLSESSSARDAFGMTAKCAEDDPFEMCSRSEMARTLANAIEKLTAREQQVLALYYFEEHTMKEIARVLKVQESRISQIITAALNRIRVSVEKRQR